MSIRTTYSAETWDKVYNAFSEINFTSFDFNTIKQSLVDYTREYFPEHFNDYIESSEFVAMLEMFAYIAEQLAYRIDMVAHENFITTAQRKQSILKLAKLISYKATRNIPVRGLVKINSITTTERVLDSRSIDLAGVTITWDDPNNSNWKEQFLLVMNRVLSTRFGQPQKSVEIDDVVMDLYSLNNNVGQFTNGVYSYTASTGVESFPMEIVPTDVDADGPFEREPDLNSALSIIYANDGIGDGSDYTGFLMFTKQGSLTRIDYNLSEQLPNRRLNFEPTNVNHTDVWVQQLNDDGTIASRWVQVDTVNEENLTYNSTYSTRKKYEVDTRENDQITIIFGDGDFNDAPVGQFRFWMRQSANRSLVIQKSKIQNQTMSFSYTSSIGNIETCTITFSLCSTLQNGSATETIEHIRQSAPSTFYSRNRMVNGQDYNTYLLKDPSILRLKAINRTFAGQPKYIDWADASGQYENVKLFGDDLTIKYELQTDTMTTSVSGRSLIDEVIEPLLKTSGVVNTLLHISATDPYTWGVVSSPRRQFIEDNRGSRYYDENGAEVAVYGNADGSLKEKTAMQGLIDRHWYGEPLSLVQTSSGTVLAVIPDPSLHPEDDSKIYDKSLPRTIDGVNKYPPGDTGSGLQPISDQKYFGLRYNRTMRAIGDGAISIAATGVNSNWVSEQYFKAGEVWTIEVQADGATLAIRSNLRGSFPTGTIGDAYSIQPAGFSSSVEMFTVTQGTTAFAAGDAFILDTAADGSLYIRTTGSNGLSTPWGANAVNLNGWWEIMDTNVMLDYNDSMPNEQVFTTSSGSNKQHSWVIFVKKLFQSPSNTVIGYEVYYRDLKLIVSSDTTKFWYNNVDQIIDSETLKRVYDNIKILRSNLDSAGNTLGKSQVYDVVGAISDSDGVINVNKLEIVPSDMLQEDSSGDLIPDRLLQFETFAADSYEYFLLNDSTKTLINNPGGQWAPGATVDDSLTYGRNLRMPAYDPSNAADAGLDFMWQHFSPFTNIIDPSTSNIHDVYVMTRGYYDNVMSYVRGTSTSAPTAPTPLELQNSYSELLTKKMLSDTVVMHAGKIKLLFGSLADPQLRAKFKIVKSASASLTNERIKEEVLTVINTYFDIDNWDFGDTFYATDLIRLIHQRLPADIATVVPVPVYSTNSFGSLFTVESGIDEILQSAAELSDIEIVDALTATTIRQS